MKNKNWIVEIFFLVLIVSIGIFINYSDDGKNRNDEKKVGVIIPLSGEIASLGEKVRNGIELAMENFKTRFSVKFIYEDGSISPRNALTAYQKLKNVDGTKIFIGPFGPDQTLAIAPILEPEDLMLSITLCENRFQLYRQIFCTYPSLPEQIMSVLPIIESEDIQRLALIVPNTELGEIVEGEINKAASSHDYQVVAIEKIKLGDTDFRTQIIKIKAANPDGILIGSLPQEGYRLLKQLSELRFSGTKMAIFDAEEKLLQDLGPAAEGVYLPGHISPVFDRNFTQQYKEKYKQDPDLYAALGHSIATVLLEAIDDGTNLTDKILELSGETAITDFKLKEDRTVSIPVETLIFRDGKIREL